MRGTGVVVLALLVSACGRAEERVDAPAPTPTSIPTESLDAGRPAGEEPEPAGAGCNLDDRMEPAYATLTDDGKTLVAIFDGHGIAPIGLTGFYVSIYDADGNGGQIGAKYQDGKLIAYFVDVPIGTNEYVEGEPHVSGNEVVLTFPKNTSGLAGMDVVKWNATYSVDGQDVGKCPEGEEETLPFPPRAPDQ